MCIAGRIVGLSETTGTQERHLPLDKFIICAYAAVASTLLRRWRLTPNLSDPQVMALKLVGDPLGMPPHKQMRRYFHHHCSALGQCSIGADRQEIPDLSIYFV